MSATRDDVIEYARGLEGVGADPADPDNRAAYLALIAPGESAVRAAQMAAVSGCALVQRGILRRFIEHPRLTAKYVTARACADLLTIAREAGGARPGKTPEPGDILIIGGGADGGGAEHAYMALEVAESEEEAGTLLVTGLDGGQRDDGGEQLIVVREHTLTRGWDRAEDANDPGGGSRRKIRFVLDLDAILTRFGRSEPGA